MNKLCTISTNPNAPLQRRRNATPCSKTPAKGPFHITLINA